jgi:hypothetical protein
MTASFYFMINKNLFECVRTVTYWSNDLLNITSKMLCLCNNIIQLYLLINLLLFYLKSS